MSALEQQEPLLLPASQGSSPQQSVALTASRNRRRRRDGRASSLSSSLSTVNDDDEDDDDFLDEPNNGFWPPWPFNLLTKSRKNQEREQKDSSLFWVFFMHNLGVGFRQMQHVGSQLWFHLPPATPPLVLLALRPGRRSLEEAATAAAPALFGNPFVRKLALASLCAAILSWSHSELHRTRRLVDLPLPEAYRDVTRAILPPTLPEEVPEVEILRTMMEHDHDDDDKVDEHETEQNVETDDDESQQSTNNGGDDTIETEEEGGLSPRLKRHLQQIYHVAPKPKSFRATFSSWRRMREVRRLEAEKVRRATIVDELIALQALKKQSKKRKKSKSLEKTTRSSEEELGYALVTGASRGIGRAIAVELARWEIPLILVARDIEKLSVLANEIEACYGVKCCVLQADLAKPDAAMRIHKTTQAAGFKVDVLVNNAGLCTTGFSVDMPAQQIQNMLQVNVMSVSTLNHLYGRDMKEQGRGRILVVSSIVGSVAAGPNVATYAGTKAFEKSLAMSMARELEPYGVGVTCLLPGAVRGTAFRSRSNSEEALCWKLPFYPKTASSVASQGVRAMLSGDVECVPGWQNRFFLRVMKPVLPQRLTTLIVEMAWSPFHLTFPRIRRGASGTPQTQTTDNPESSSIPQPSADVTDFWRGAAIRRTPRLLHLPEESSGKQAESPGRNKIDAPMADDEVARGTSSPLTKGSSEGEAEDAGQTKMTEFRENESTSEKVSSPKGKLDEHNGGQ